MTARFYFVAGCAGFAFANMALAVPLHVVATGAKAAVAGDVLAVGTLSIAFGAGVVGPRLGGGSRMLRVALAVIGLGSAILAAASGVGLLTAGAAVVGMGIGMFWVASQLILSRRSGEPDSGHGFLSHYAIYTLGGLVGSGLTGAFAGGASALGLAEVTGIRVSSALAVAVLVVALALWRGSAVAAPGVAVAKPQPAAPSRGLVVQVPDLLLVAALALLLPLAPVVLAREFGLSPFAIGLVTAGVAGSKIAGTVAARLIARGSGPRRTILLLLGGGAVFCVVLCAALTLSLFVTALFATALATTGAWPLVVDAAQARVDPAARRSLTVRWNAREYALIAVTTLASGWLLTTLGSAVPLFAIAAFLFACSAASAAILLRRPVWWTEPQPS
jgi:MFS family permease